MPAPATTTDVASLLKKTRLLSDSQIDEFIAAHPALGAPADVLAAMRKDGLLTPFQAEQLLKGRHKGFVLGKYRLLDRIGMGGMGQVYLAEHATMRRRVAVKVLPPNRSENPFARERFLREARAAAHLEHPNIVRAHDLETDGEVTFLVMDYIEGATLHDLVMRRGPQPVARVAHFVKMVAEGLRAIHERQLVHRDIKPANLLMDRHGTVRLLDLGLVRSELDDDALTRGEGAKIVGTADYLAPEQAVSSSKVDGRADLYSLGCTAYFLLTGTPPFQFDKLSQKLIAHQAQDPKPLHLVRPMIPVEFSVVIMKLLAKKPEQRWQSAAELLAALEPWTREPCEQPKPEDFPNRNEAVYGPVTYGLSLSSRINLCDESSGRHALPGLSGALSDIRTQPDSSPKSDSDVGHNTAPSAEQETLRDTPRPKLPDAPTPAVAVEKFVPAPRSEVTESRVAAIFGTVVPPPNSHRSVWLAAAVGLVLLLGGIAVLVFRR
jgi:serine/threonine protein kinase